MARLEVTVIERNFCVCKKITSKIEFLFKLVGAMGYGRVKIRVLFSWAPDFGIKVES